MDGIIAGSIKRAQRTSSNATAKAFGREKRAEERERRFSNVFLTWSAWTRVLLQRPQLVYTPLGSARFNSLTTRRFDCRLNRTAFELVKLP